MKLPVRTVLELACSAQRTLGRYIKEGEIWIQNINPKETPKILPNKWLIQSTLRLMDWPDRLPPKDLVVTDEDRKLADQIENFYRWQVFSVIADNGSFESTLYSLLSNTEIEHNNLGFIACAPSIYSRERSKKKVEKASRLCDHEYLGIVGSTLYDLDSEIIEVIRSKNFDAWNIIAIIDNKMASWLSNPELHIGPAVIVKAKIKDLSQHYKHNNPVTRLHYVKAAQ